MSEKEAVAAYRAALRAKARRGWSPYLKAAGAFALITVTAALLFPTYPPGIISSTAQSMSNMKQLSLALSQYEQDNNNELPSATSADGRGWREAIYPFVKSVGVYARPDDDTEHHNTPDDLPRSFAANHIGPDSQRNERGALAVAGERPLTPVQFTDPSAMIVLVSVRGVDGEYWNITDAAFLPQTGRELFAAKPRHAFYQHPNGVALFAFLDGHVRAVRKPTETVSPDLWTRDKAPFMGQDLQNAQTILKHTENE